MKQLVFGGILMITGMLGVIAAILALSASIADNASIMFLIAFAGIILFAIMAFLGYYEHVRPAMKDKGQSVTYHLYFS